MKKYLLIGTAPPDTLKKNISYLKKKKLKNGQFLLYLLSFNNGEFDNVDGVIEYPFKRIIREHNYPILNRFDGIILAQPHNYNQHFLNIYRFLYVNNIKKVNIIFKENILIKRNISIMNKIIYFFMQFMNKLQMR